MKQATTGANANLDQSIAKVLKRKVRLYDNGGKSADRYTAVYMFEPERSGLYAARGMNAHPFHPQGIGMSCAAMPGRHLGRRVAFTSLPVDCQKLVRQDVREYCEFITGH